ncbi:MAG TPA: TIGR02221 family CRISPR-associated protein [Candidatus Obscuribacterales bacterium]
MKAISFLGKGEYDPVRYYYGEKECETHLFPYAVTQFFRPAELLVFLTPEAKNFVPKKRDPNNTKTHFETLCEEHEKSGLIIPRAVDIPNGGSEAELWQIFQAMTDVLEDNDEVVFDITYAFRSLPLLAFIAAAYLRVAKQIKLRTIVYGAFDAKQDGRAPVFDLSPFLGLLDWIAATDKFVKTGDARELADLLKAAHSVPWRSAPFSDRNHLPRHLQGLGATLEKLSQALALTRPPEIANQASELDKRLDAAAGETVRWAQPFTVLLERTRSAYQPFAEDTLAKQRNLVHWYNDRGQAIQAITLAREWIVSWTCIRLGKDKLTEREIVEIAINQAALQKRGQTVEDESPLLPSLRALPEVDRLVRVWGEISDLRNDVAHCGMRLRPRPASTIVQSTKELAYQLDLFSLPEEES